MDFFFSVCYNLFIKIQRQEKRESKAIPKGKNEAMENKIIDTGKVSEYRISGTTYFVRTVFNCQNESLDEIIQRLIVNDCQKSSVNTDEITDSSYKNFTFQRIEFFTKMH